MQKNTFTQEQLQIIKDTINNDADREKLLDYLNRHEVVGKEIFPYLDKSKSAIDYKFMYFPISCDVFIRRLPIYFYQKDIDNHDVGDFSQYAMGLYADYHGSEGEFPKDLENLYGTIEKMHYYHRLNLKTIFNYPIDQTGYISRTKFLIQWAHYLELAEEYGVQEKTPVHFIVDYNYILEKAGLKPIVYEIQEQYIGEYAYRMGNVIRVEGFFPCDDRGNPIMRWIGIDVVNPKKIWAEVNKKLKGYLFIEVNPKTAISGLNCWGPNDDGSDCWYPLYTGPLLMEFDYEKLKDLRKKEKLTQKQVAEAIGAAERTYQKWESGTTTPDCIYLLRLMNVLDVRDIEELTRVNS